MTLPANQEMIWLIDCWSVHINIEFRDWMKTHHSEILVLYVPANYTSIYQPADVVIQRPFKHAFRQEFNKFTMDTISSQLKGGEDVQMNFKMSKLKPHLCHWLYKAWINVSSITDMISKGWTQISLLRAFDNDFQKQTMLDNMVRSLFNNNEVEVEVCDTECNEDIDVEVSLETVMEENLTRVVELSKTINSNRMVSIRELARRKT